MRTGSCPATSRSVGWPRNKRSIVLAQGSVCALEHKGSSELLRTPGRRCSCILRARNRPPTARGNMAREPERKLVDRTFRCIDEDFLFPGKMEYVGHEIIVPGGGTRIEWRPNQSRANCP